MGRNKDKLYYIDFVNPNTSQLYLSIQLRSQLVLCRCPQLECARREMWPGKFSVDMLVTHPDMCRELLGRRYPALRRTGIPEQEGGGSQ